MILGNLKKKWIIAINIILVFIIVFLLVTSIKPAFVKNLKEKDLVKIVVVADLLCKDDFKLTKKGVMTFTDDELFEKIKETIVLADFRSYGIDFFDPPLEGYSPLYDNYYLLNCRIMLFYADDTIDDISTNIRLYIGTNFEGSKPFEFGVFSTPKKERAFLEKIIEVTNASELMKDWEVS